MRKRLKNIPINIWIPAIFFIALCVFSLYNGIYYLWGAFNEDLLITDSLNVVIDGLTKTFDMAEWDLGDFSWLAGVLTAGVAILQGIVGFGLLAKNKILYIIAIAFVIFSLFMVITKAFVVITLFGTTKFILYIVMLVLLLIPKSRNFVFKKNN
ncbi:MAG: hypothetical protein Q4E88_02585 [Coriobacteriia bacterium]|nr:hypothetical protein [Coriobacteriia bacterium]